jgi:hypothetical protein
MTAKESEKIEMTKEEARQVQAAIQYKNQIIGKIQQHAEQGQTSSTFISFLSVNRPIPQPDDPKNFFTDDGYTTWIHSYPPSAEVNIVGWSGSYWPMRNGGTSLRYNKNDKNTIGDIDASGNVGVVFYSAKDNHLIIGVKIFS